MTLLQSVKFRQIDGNGGKFSLIELSIIASSVKLSTAWCLHLELQMCFILFLSKQCYTYRHLYEFVITVYTVYSLFTLPTF